MSGAWSPSSLRSEVDVTPDIMVAAVWAERELADMEFGRIEIQIVVHHGRIGHVQRSSTVTSRQPDSTSTSETAPPTRTKKRRQP